MPRLLVIGASQGIGLAVCKTAVGRGHSVRAMSRRGTGGDSDEAINIFQRLPFKVLLRNAYNDKSIQEQLVVASDLDWLIVRPGVLSNLPASGSYQVLTAPTTWRNGVISRADVAEFIVTRISANQFNREKPVLIRHPL
jgi:uncharacterized protein YbjT (DUF2867 family)